MGPRGPQSAAARQAASRRMKARWRRLKAETPDRTNGLQVESRLILHVQGHELSLTAAEAQTLRTALNEAVGDPDADAIRADIEQRLTTLEQQRQPLKAIGTEMP
jgi:hypothetical protein